MKSACGESLATPDRVCLDLCDLTFVDAAGARFLASLIRDGAQSYCLLRVRRGNASPQRALIPGSVRNADVPRSRSGRSASLEFTDAFLPSTDNTRRLAAGDQYGPSRAVPRMKKPAAKMNGGAMSTGKMDGGAMDKGKMDGGAMDKGKMDGGAMDKGKMDGGAMDKGKMDGGAMDKGKMEGAPK